MVLAGSFHGLVAFGRNVLGWNGGAEFLVPGTLDGVTVTFAFLAFRAVHKRRDPGRCQRVVWAASLSSATVNFAYEYGYTHHNVVAGAYLALLSVFGMMIFHEFLAQFEEGAEYVRRNKRPPWGLRWFTSPLSTFCGAIAWENFPPADGTPATVLNGLANLERVRQLKRTIAEARTAERHERAMAQARRCAELAAVHADPPPATAPEIATPERPASRLEPTQATDDSGTELRRSVDTRFPRRPVADRPGEPSDDAVGVKIPTQAATVAQWANLWVRMCADGDLVCGSLNNDEYAREVYCVSGRQLRAIRAAAVSGGLERRATKLGVQLPERFVSNPARRINGHVFEPQAA